MNLSTHISQKSMKKGFTLVELLIVIGILGILAAGLLAAIDPLEQLKKGRDNTRRSVAVELTNAMSRYYAVFGTMPFGTGDLAASNITGFSSSIGLLTGAGELKPTFMNALPAGATSGPYALSVMGGANGAGFSVCFDPESKSLSRDPTTLFSSITGFPPVQGTNGGTADTGFYWCTR